MLGPRGTHIVNSLTASALDGDFNFVHNLLHQLCKLVTPQHTDLPTFSRSVQSLTKKNQAQ